MIEDKVALTRKRAELVDRLATPLSVEDRIRIQGDLRVVNAQIKALNTTEAAQLKAAADRRKAAGMAEAQANAERSRARLGAGAPDDPAQTAAVDAWIIAVFQRGGVKVHRASDGNLDLIDAPAKWIRIVDALCAGIHAACRGEELPEVESATVPRRKENS
jgi:hypothetical protein